MTSEPRVRINFPFALYRTSLREAKAYADMLSTQNDMRHTREFVEESIRRHSDNDVITQALFSAAHMSYRRCFNRGNGGLGKRDLMSLTNEQREIHDYHYGQADKLIAHSVNGFEIMHVGIHLDGDKIGIGHIAARLVGLDTPDLEKWRGLISHIESNILVPKLKEAENVALARAQRISREDILRAGLINEGAPDRSGATRRR